MAKANCDCKAWIEALGPMEPLVFAVSMATVNSLSGEDIRVNFNRDKDDFMEQPRV